MAVKDGRLSRNVAAGVNLPRVRKPEHRYLTHQQVDDLAVETGYPREPSKHNSMDARSNETYRLVVLFLAYTGSRYGEIAALRISRLDLRRNRAMIAELAEHVRGKGANDLVLPAFVTVSRFASAPSGQHSQPRPRRSASPT